MFVSFFQFSEAMCILVNKFNKCKKQIYLKLSIYWHFSPDFYISLYMIQKK